VERWNIGEKDLNDGTMAKRISLYSNPTFQYSSIPAFK